MPRTIPEKESVFNCLFAAGEANRKSGFVVVKEVLDFILEKFDVPAS